MKKCYFLFLLFFVFSVTSFGQQVPMGMKYQAVARDLKGNVLADQQITLKINLAGNNNQSWTSYYSETHSVQTSQLGLFTLVVGEGVAVQGKFAEVPWSTEDIWMEVAIKDNTGFATISNSRLLAVPFAFHALTANQIVGTEIRGPGIPGNVWSLFGNSSSNPENDALGTTDNVDLVMITNNIERMRLLADGNINIARSLNIGANLKVDSNVVLNDKMGSTINNGPFTVARNSPTLLSGTLTVDLATDLNASLNVDGPTDLNSRLNVNNQKPTKLTGTLQVDGVTTLNDSTFVANGKPTILTGTLRVDSNATYKQKVILDNAALDQDTATLVPNGALQVAGGGGFGGNLTIGGSAKIGGGLSLGNLKVTDTTSSTSTSTGAATVAGGVGIGKQLYVGGNTVINNSLSVNAGTGQVVLTGGTSGDDQTTASYPLVVNGKNQGIQITLASTALPDNSNNYITFKDNTNVVRGRIEGQTLSELTSDPWYQWDVTNYTLYVVFAAVDVGFAIAEFIAALSDIRVCVGLGICVTSPSISVSIVKALVMVATVLKLAQAAVNLAEYISVKNNNLGVSYSSGAGDYAEWLPKENTGIKMSPGQVIGVRNGLISLNTTGAERVLVISTNPIILGNNPEPGKEFQVEKVAFLGQVPVRVVGKVNTGDYILASNKNDGTGVAKHPDDITLEDISNIVGIAWSVSDQAGEKAIKVAVGLTANDLKYIVQKLEQKVNNQVVGMNELKKQFNENNERLSKLIPGFKATALPLEKVVLNEKAIIPANEKKQIQFNKGISSVIDISSHKTTDNTALINKVKNEIGPLVAAKIGNQDGDRYPEMTDELISKLLELGIDYSQKSSDIDNDTNYSNVLLQKINSDHAFKEFLYNKIKVTYKQKVEEQKLLIKQQN